MMNVNGILQRLKWISGVMLLLCFGCATFDSTSSPTQTQEIILSPTSRITLSPTLTLSITMMPTPTLTLTSTRDSTLTPTSALTRTPTTTSTPSDGIIGVFVHGVLVHYADTRTGLDEVDQIIDIVLAGDINEFRRNIKFTTSGCTHLMALGGPPKCREGESEGALVEVLPFLGSEGHFLRRDELNDWQGIDVAGLYAVYLVSNEAFSDENHPAGEYGIVFNTKNPRDIVTLQVENGSILRIDWSFGTPPEINFEKVAQEVILQPPDINNGCPGSASQRVMIGDKAIVCTQSDDLIVRKGPGLDGKVLTGVEPGTILLITDGPACADKWFWWKVELDSGLEGWIAEGGDDVDPYFICPVE
jgi:hypothetical protein